MSETPCAPAAVEAAPHPTVTNLTESAGATAGTAAPASAKKTAAKKAPAEGDLIIPKGSVKRVIKIDKDVRLVAADAVLLITKATVRIHCGVKA